MMTSKSRSLKATIVAAAFLLAGFAIPGLSLASIGGFEISNALTENFNTDHFNSGYHYYALMDPHYPQAPYAISWTGERLQDQWPLLGKGKPRIVQICIHG